MEEKQETEAVLLERTIIRARMVALYVYICSALKRRDAIMEAPNILNRVFLGCW